MKSKVVLSFLGSILIVLGCVVFADFSETELLLNKDTQIVKYDDGETIGNSICSISKTDSEVCFQYTLGDKAPYPFAGIKLSSAEGFDLSSRDYLTLHTTTSVEKHIHVFYATKHDSSTNRMFRSELACVPNKTAYRLRLDEFTTPSWWFKNNRVLDEALHEADYSNVISINVENDVFVERGQADSVCVSSITVSSDNTYLVYIGLCLIILFNTGIFLWTLISKKKKVEIAYVATTHKPVQQDTSGDDLQAVINYINTHYQNPELSLKLMRSDLKITENRISALIKSEFTISYKDYLHQIRISEAKRLFKESDLNINEVSALVGYGDISTFNRVFKKKEGLTPGAFISNLTVT